MIVFFSCQCVLYVVGSHVVYGCQMLCVMCYVGFFVLFCFSLKYCKDISETPELTVILIHLRKFEAVISL